MILKQSLILKFVLAVNAFTFTTAFVPHTSSRSCKTISTSSSSSYRVGQQMHIPENTVTFLREGSFNSFALSMSSDEEIEQKIGLSRKDHENRNQLNELPNGKLKPSAEDSTIWKDDDGRPWKLNAEPNAAYHQPMSVPVAFIRAYASKLIPSLKVPNLKFISPNADGRYSEVCANRYTGELVIDQKIIGTFNLATDAPDAMKDGKLPTTGEHDTWDVIPHKKYGGKYKQIAKGVEIGSLEKGPVILQKTETEKSKPFWILSLILIIILNSFGALGQTASKDL